MLRLLLLTFSLIISTLSYAEVPNECLENHPMWFPDPEIDSPIVFPAVNIPDAFGQTLTISFEMHMSKKTNFFGFSYFGIDNLEFMDYQPSDLVEDSQCHPHLTATGKLVIPYFTIASIDDNGEASLKIYNIEFQKVNVFEENNDIPLFSLNKFKQVGEIDLQI
jgi:hypothetical protein